MNAIAKAATTAAIVTAATATGIAFDRSGLGFSAADRSDEELLATVGMGVGTAAMGVGAAAFGAYSTSASPLVRIASAAAGAGILALGVAEVSYGLRGQQR